MHRQVCILHNSHRFAVAFTDADSTQLVLYKIKWRHSISMHCHMRCLAQVDPKKTPKSSAPKSSAQKPEKAEPLYESASDSEEEESADQKDDSSSESPASDAKTAAKSAKARKFTSRTPHTVRASSKKAAKAIAAACVDLENDASDKDESPNASDSEAETEPTESPSAMVVQEKGSKLSQKKKRMSSEPPSHDSDVETDGVRRQSSNSSSPEGIFKKSEAEEQRAKSAEKGRKSPASSDDLMGSRAHSQKAESEVESEAESEAERGEDPEAESPVPVMLISRKLQKADGSAIQSKANDNDKGNSFVCSAEFAGVVNVQAK